MDKYNEYGELVSDNEDETVEELTEVPQGNELFRQVQGKLNAHGDGVWELPREPQQVPDDVALAQIREKLTAKSDAAMTGTPPQPSTLPGITKADVTTPPLPKSSSTVPVGEREFTTKMQQIINNPSKAMAEGLASAKDVEILQKALAERELFGGVVDGKPYKSFQQEFKEAMEKAGRGAAEIGKATDDQYKKDARDAATASAIDKGIGALGKIVAGTVGLNPNMAFSGSRVLPVAEHYKYEPQVDQKELMDTAKQSSSLGMQRAKGLTESVKMREAARQKEAKRMNDMFNQMRERSGDVIKATGMDKTTKDLEKKAIDKTILDTTIGDRLNAATQKAIQDKVDPTIAKAAFEHAQRKIQAWANTQLNSEMHIPANVTNNYNKNPAKTVTDLRDNLQTLGIADSPAAWEAGLHREAQGLAGKNPTTGAPNPVTGEHIAQAYQNFGRALTNVQNSFGTDLYPKWVDQMLRYWGVVLMPIGATIADAPTGARQKTPGVIQKTRK